MNRPFARPGRLTAAKVDNTPIGTLTDPAVAGLMIRTRETATRGVVREYRFRYKFGGKTRFISLGRHPGLTLVRARAKAQHYRELLGDGIDPSTAIPKKRRSEPPTEPAEPADSAPNSIATLLREFIERHLRPRRRRPEYAERILAKELASWMHRDARTIQPREVIQLLDVIVERPAPVMANRVAGLLSQLFRFGIHRQIVDTSPVQLLFRPGGKERPKQRALSDAELAALLGDLDASTKRAPRTGIAIRLLLLTAVRRGELALASWSEFDLKSPEPSWTVPGARTKTGVDYAVPLVPRAVAELALLKRMAPRSTWLFPADDGDGPMDPKLLTRSLARHATAFKNLGVEPFGAHDLRRTVRTGLAKLGVRPDIAERCLNHAQPDLIATYDVHQYLEEKRAAMLKWAAHLDALSVPKSAQELPA